MDRSDKPDKNLEKKVVRGVLLAGSLLTAIIEFLSGNYVVAVMPAVVFVVLLWKKEW